MTTTKIKKCRKCRNRFEPSTDGRPRLFCSNRCRQQAYRRRRKIPVYHRSKSDNWPTDPQAFAELDREFGFTLDVCASPENAKCANYYTAEQDGLQQTWTGRVFCNPPYGRTSGHWIRKGYESVQAGTAELVVLLLPAKTDTRWWHDWCVRGEVRLLKGRLRFGDLKYPAPFGSALVVFRNEKSVTKPGTAERKEP